VGLGENEMPCFLLSFHPLHRSEGMINQINLAHIYTRTWKTARASPLILITPLPTPPAIVNWSSYFHLLIHCRISHFLLSQESKAELDVEGECVCGLEEG
jgi:hypothetical protein